MVNKIFITATIMPSLITLIFFGRFTTPDPPYPSPLKAVLFLLPHSIL